MAARLPTTSWTLVIAAGGAAEPRQAEARAALCARYWYPVYAFVRHRGASAEDAHDLTQSFFLSLLERNDFATLSPTRGRFRSWLLASVKHHLANRRDHDRTEKRGGKTVFESFDAGEAHQRYSASREQGHTPETLYERHFALALLDATFEELRSEYKRRNREDLFEALQGRLGGKGEIAPHDDVASRLGMTTLAVKTAASRLKDEYSRLLRQRVMELVDDEGDVQDELSHLLRALDDPG